MAGPNGTAILDNFNRANGALGANWDIGFTTYAMPTIVTNQITFPQFPSCVWVDSSFGPGSEVYSHLTGSLTSIFYLLCFGNRNSGTETGYGVHVDIAGGAAEAWKYTAGGGTGTSLGFSNGIMLTTDVWSGASITGGTITAWGSSDGITWNNRHTWSDSTYTTGFIGLYNPNNATTSTIDDFGGGNFGVVAGNPTFSFKPLPVFRGP